MTYILHLYSSQASLTISYQITILWTWKEGKELWDL